MTESDHQDRSEGGEPLEFQVESRSPEETEAFGAFLASTLTPGQGLALHGEMGSGKTVLTRGIAKGLGVEGADEVTSPSYLLMLEYPGPIPLYHFDAYFAAKERGFLGDGGEVLLEGDGVAVVEWADRLGDALPAHFLEVHFQVQGETGRQMTLRSSAGEWKPLFSLLTGFSEHNE